MKIYKIARLFQEKEVREKGREWFAQKAKEDMAKQGTTDFCPVCYEHYVNQCRCYMPPGQRHNIEDLKKGHGRKCKNGHRWSGETVYIPEKDKS